MAGITKNPSASNFVMSEAEAELVKERMAELGHYQPVGISAKDGRRRLHHSP